MRRKSWTAWLLALALVLTQTVAYATTEDAPPQEEGAPIELVAEETPTNETENQDIVVGEEDPVEPIEVEPSTGDDIEVVTQADNNTPIAQVTIKGQSAVAYTDLTSLFNALNACAEKTFTVKLLGNLNTHDAGMFPIPAKSTATLDLNGYSINRHMANAEYETDDNREVVLVNNDAKLTITDSNPSRVHGGYLAGDTPECEIWFENEGSSCSIKGGVIAGGASDNGGGGITIKDNATVTMKGGTIAGNISYDGGGGVQLRGSNSKFTLDGGNIMFNGAWREKGGGIKAQNGIVEIISGNIWNNWAHAGTTTDGDGGGIYINQEDERALYIHGTNTSADGKESRSASICYNRADDEGGGIYIDEGTATIMNAELVGNTCLDGDGGAILVNDDGTGANLTAITACYISGNNAEGDGGGIAITDENYIQIANCIITSNTAGDEGGGVYFNAYGDGCCMTGCTITSNTANRNGGGIYLYDTVAIGGKMVVKDNSAGDGRNNLYNYGYLTTPTLVINDLSADSEMYIHSDWDNEDVITSAPSSGSAKGLYGEGDYHFEKVSDPKDSHYRYFVQKSGKATPQPTMTIDAWKNVNRDQSASATNLGYTMQIDESKGTVNNAPVYMGYLRFSDPSLTLEGYYHSMNYYYSDGLFFNDPTVYNKHLATLTSSLTMASGASSKGITTVLDPSTQTNRFNYLTQVFSDIGCTNESMYVNDCYLRKPEVDTMGVAMANKTIYKDNIESEDNARLLIPVFVRSYNYGMEWVSNFTLGDGKDNNGEAKGFSSSADIVMRDLATYIKNHPEVKSAIDSGKAIFWLGGYSRGGAVTNIVAKRLTDQYTGGKSGTSTGNEVFAYCKAAAQGGIEKLDKKGGYLNIHNIINPSDLITYVGPSEMGLKRYGVDHYLPGGDAGKITTKTETYGPNDETLTTYSDNTAYDVNYDDNNYMQLRNKLVTQLAVIMPNIEFDDYYSPAEVNYFWGNDYTSWVPFIGSDMITEATYEPLSTKAKFCKQLWARLLKYASNSSNAGHDIATTLYSKDFRDFYANNTTGHFMPGSKYNKQGCASLQDALCTLVGLAMGGEKEFDFSNMVDISGAAGDIALDAYDELIGDLYTDNTSTEYTAWLDKIWGILTTDPTEEQRAKGFKNLKDILGDDIKKANDVYPTIMAMVLDLVNDDYNDTDKGQYLVGTMVYNAANIIPEHIVNIGWIRADDDWYANDDKTLCHITIDSSAPQAPGAWLSGTPQTALENGSTSKASYSQRLFLRTQPGGAVYYTMTVDGAQTVSDALYQGADGIELPAGKTVRITTYAMAFEQKGAEATYTIEVAPKPKSIAKATVTGIKASYSFNGNAKRPAVTVELNGTTLVRGTDYTVSYSNNVNVGTATVRIVGKGAYTGTISKNFNVVPAGTSLQKLAAGKKALAAAWTAQPKKMAKSRINGYQIQVATNSKFTKNKKAAYAVGYKTVKRKITKLLGKKRYYVRVRTYKIVNNTKYYSRWSAVEKITTKE